MIDMWPFKKEVVNETLHLTQECTVKYGFNSAREKIRPLGGFGNFHIKGLIKDFLQEVFNEQARKYV